jgi:hypothetical protein
MPSNATLDNVQEGNYTLSAWFYPFTAPPDVTTDNRHWAIVAKAGHHMGLMYEPDRRFSIRHYLAGPALKNPHSATTYSLNTWHHVAGVVSKTAGTVTLYVNGAVAGTTTFPADSAAREYGTTRFRIGKGSSNWAADGKVDQVRIYNRALSGAEISDLYNETTGPGGVSNCIGAPSNGADKTTYSEKRVFLESQGWWGERTNNTVPKYGDAEHLHVGFCFPLRDTVSGTTKFIVRVMGHRLPVGSVIQSTGLHDPNEGAGTHIGLGSIAWNHTITQADHDHPDGWVKWDSVTVDTEEVPNGLREVRNLTKVVRPASAGGAEIHASSGWCWTIANTGGGAPVDSGTCETSPTFTMARGWYDCFEYKIAEVRNWDPYANIQSGADYTLTIGGRDGSGPNNHNLITGWEVRLDPDFHAGDTGDLIDSGSTPAYGVPVTIDGSLMTPGVHRVTVITSANGACTGSGIPSQNGEVSGVLAIPVKVN